MTSAPEKLEKEWQKRVVHYIRLITEHDFYNTKVHSVLEDALALSGKMIRPALLIRCGMLGSHWLEKHERLCLLAAMVELVHTASLIHDDIIDNAPYRRGRPSVQSKYGKKAAVYAGDFIIARIHYHAANNNLSQAAAVLSKTIEAMCYGEIGQAVCSYNEEVTIDEYFLNIQGKTSALFKAACILGACETGCSKEVVQKLETFGENFGYMFQLKDDMLDFTSSQTVQGKKVHKDFISGVYTFPVLAAIQQSDARKSILPIMRANAERRLTQNEIAELEAAVIRFGGIEAVCKKIASFSHINRALIDELEQSNEVSKEGLIALGAMLDLLEDA